jgi:hypothetical protein
MQHRQQKWSGFGTTAWSAIPSAAVALVIATLGQGAIASVASAAEPAAKDESLPFKITSKRADDVVKIEATAEQAVLDVRSPFGISEATITRTGKSWPAAFIVRLNLKGMEHFEVTDGKTTVQAAASPSGEFKPRVWRGQDEKTTLTEKDDWWLAISRNEIKHSSKAEKPPVGEDRAGEGKRTSFDIVLPRALFEHNPKTITVRWIDFYRG